MPTKLELFLNGDQDGKTDRERLGKQVIESGKPFTHWSFENKQKWSINEDDLEEFYKLYCAEIRDCTPQYLTEKSTAIGQLRVDLDFKYDGLVQEHKHTQSQVISFIKSYMEEVRKWVEVPESAEIYILEKRIPTFVKPEKISKSGIHIQVPSIKTRPDVEQGIRRVLVRRMEEFFPDLGLKNSWDDVYDKQPLTHTNNWPVLGSKKVDEGSQPYQIRYILDWDSETGDISVDTDVPQVISPELVKKMSVRSKNSEETPLTEFGKENSRPPREPVTRAVSRGRAPEREEPSSRGSSPGRIYIEPLSEIKRKYIERHVRNLGEQRYNGSHNDWYAVCQCLKNIHPDLEDVFLDFIEQTTDEKRKAKARATWNGCQLRVEGEARYGIETLRKWSRSDNLQEFLEIEKTNIDSLVNEAANSSTEYDIAQVIHARYRDEFKCSNLRQNDWFRYETHIWKTSEHGVDLYLRLSSDIAKLFLEKESAEISKIAVLGECGHKDPNPTCPTCQAEERKKKYSNIRIKMKRTGFKDSVMKECRAMFYDRDFAQKVDENKHLIAFNNGVFDTLTREFRPGQPEDCISFCTKLDYAMDTEYHQFSCWKELQKFLHDILPNKNVREYFLKHLATCLSGVFNQRFHILTGSGSNGKSMLMNLCSTAFGDYCYKANIAMFTQKRGKAGAANPELVRMKGKRFVMMSEPDEGEPLSTGFMKELTSSEKVSGRDLFQGSKQMVEFDIQAKIHLACNEKPKINTTDGGTWRRLKVVDFPNKFVHEPKASNELPIDEDIMQKVVSKEWAECFMAYLVHLYKEGKGLQKLVPPSEVEAYTSEYKEDSDSVAKFMMDYFHELENNGEAPDAVNMTSIITSFREWKRSNETYNGSVSELRKRIEEKYGKLPKGGWTTFKFGPV
jgi:P4 family phage/plasmid primase-like protien